MDWKEVKLGKLCSIKHGWAFKGKYFSEKGKYILLTPGNFLEQGGLKLKGEKEKYYKGDFPKEFLLEKDDLVVVMTDLIQNAPILGGSAKIPFDNIFLHNQRLGKVLNINKELISKNFLYWIFNFSGYRNQIKGSASGSTVRHTAPERIYKCKILLPPLPIQEKIASILSAYDDLIENNLKRIKLLEEMAQITYEEWFVRMKFPEHETTEFDKQTGLPKGWKKKKIGNVCSLSGGGTPSSKKPEYWENGNTTWFSPTDLSRSKNLYQIDSTKKITKLGLQKSSAKLLNPNSFMMTSRATIGLFGIIDKKYSTNQGFINVTPEQEIDKEFLLYNFITRIEEFKGFATGATFPELSKSKFKALQIIWPTLKIRESFHELVEPILKSVGNLTNQNQLLKEARDILLPRLMTGKINVENL